RSTGPEGDGAEGGASVRAWRASHMTCSNSTPAPPSASGTAVPLAASGATVRTSAIPDGRLGAERDGHAEVAKCAGRQEPRNEASGDRPNGSPTRSTEPEGDGAEGGASVRV